MLQHPLPGHYSQFRDCCTSDGQVCQGSVRRPALPLKELYALCFCPPELRPCDFALHDLLPSCQGTLLPQADSSGCCPLLHLCKHLNVSFPPPSHIVAIRWFPGQFSLRSLLSIRICGKSTLFETRLHFIPGLTTAFAWPILGSIVSLYINIFLARVTLNCPSCL